MFEADYQEYCNDSVEAIKDDKAFSTFKSNSTYCTILEHVSKEQGQEYLNLIKQNIQYNNIPWDLVYKSDYIGTPQTYSYEVLNNNVFTSPSNFRYVYYALEILSVLKDKNLTTPLISEIGGGYGGLCYTINILAHLFNITPLYYNIFDLRQPADLTNKYLQNIKPDLKAKAYTIDEKTFTPDINHFLISNYAYSELDKQTRLMYIDKIISKTKAGYIVWNSTDKFDLFFKSTKLDIRPETPNTGPNNQVVVYETSIG